MPKVMAYKYEVKEQPVAGYKSEVKGYDITNTKIKDEPGVDPKDPSTDPSKDPRSQIQKIQAQIQTQIQTKIAIQKFHLLQKMISQHYFLTQEEHQQK